VKSKNINQTTNQTLNGGLRLAAPLTLVLA